MDKIYESQTVVRREILDEMAEKNVELREFVLMNSDRVVDICKNMIAQKFEEQYTVNNTLL